MMSGIPEGYGLEIPLFTVKEDDGELWEEVKVLVKIIEKPKLTHQTQTAKIKEGRGTVTFYFTDYPGVLELILGPNNKSDEEFLKFEAIDARAQRIARTSAQWEKNKVVRVDPIPLPFSLDSFKLVIIVPDLRVTEQEVETYASVRASTPQLARRDEDSRDRPAYEEVDNLRKAIIVSFLVLLIILGAISWLGWSETKDEISFKYNNTALPVENPLTDITNASSGQSQTNLTTTSNTTLPIEVAQAAAIQHYVTLVILTSTAIMFPWGILLAFAYQRGPRLAKQIRQDLDYLSLHYSTLDEEIKETKKLRAVILKGLKQNVPNKNNLAANIADELLWYDIETMPKEIEKNKWSDIKFSAARAIERIDDLYIYGEFYEINELIRNRFRFSEYILPLIGVTFILMVNFVWGFWPQSIHGFVNSITTAPPSLFDYIKTVIGEMNPTIVAIMTAYAFMAIQLIRRYHRSDITPGAYWEVFKRLFVVFLLSIVISVISDKLGFPSGLPFSFAIILGIFPAKSLGILVKLGQYKSNEWVGNIIYKTDSDENNQKFSDLSERLWPRHDLSLLDDLDQWDIERIQEEGIIGIQGMTKADIAHLITWTPFPTSQIIDWVDQAILILATSAELDSPYLKTFRKIGIRGASDLIDAAKDDPSKRTIINAAKALQGSPVEDPTLLAQLSALQAQDVVKDVQDEVTCLNEQLEKVKDDSQGNGENNDAVLDENLKVNIETALSSVLKAKELVDYAHERVVAGGGKLNAALDASNKLQAKFTTAEIEVNAVKEALEKSSDKDAKDLKKTFDSLTDAITNPDAKKQVEKLVDDLNNIAKPLATSKDEATKFKGKADELLKKSEELTSDLSNVPEEVEEAIELFETLTQKGKKAQEQIQADSALSDAVDEVNKLVNLLTSENKDNPRKLLEAMNKVEQWKVASNLNKAKCYSDAVKLVKKAGNILDLVQTTTDAVEEAKAKIAGATTDPPLTRHVLDTILNGLERNPNLRRVQRYLTMAANQVKKPAKYETNNEWLEGEK